MRPPWRCPHRRPRRRHRTPGPWHGGCWWCGWCGRDRGPAGAKRSVRPMVFSTASAKKTRCSKEHVVVEQESGGGHVGRRGRARKVSGRRAARVSQTEVSAATNGAPRPYLVPPWAALTPPADVRRRSCRARSADRVGIGALGCMAGATNTGSGPRRGPSRAGGVASAHRRTRRTRWSGRSGRFEVTPEPFGPHVDTEDELRVGPIGRARIEPIDHRQEG